MAERRPRSEGIEPLPEDVTPPDLDGAFLVDLCDNEQASWTLDGGDLESERRNVGVACGPNPPEDAVRYAGRFDGAQPLYTVADRDRAIAEVRAEKRKEERARVTPAPDQYFAKSTSNGCASHGLNDYRPWAKKPSSARGDFDGDGRDDRFVVYATGPEYNGGFELRLRMELATGLIADREASEWMHEWDTQALGAGDVNRDGRDEVWIWNHANGPAMYAGMVVLHECEPTEITIEDGWPFSDRFITVPDSGPPPHEHYGLACPDAHTFEVAQMWWEDEWDGGEGEEWEAPPSPAKWKYETYRLVGTRMRLVSKDRGEGTSGRPSFLSWEDGHDDRCFKGPRRTPR